MRPLASYPQIYYRVFAALMALTGLTVGVAFLDLGPLNTAIALAIALAKATLVTLFFMHVRTSSLLTRLAVGAGVFWLVIFLLLILSDYLTRG